MSDKDTQQNIVWSETRTRLGIKLSLQVTHDRAKFTLSGTGHGYGVNISFSRPISGNMDWAGVIGRHNDRDIHLHVRIRNWRNQNNYLSFDLGLWGAYGSGSWLPPGGEWFKVAGRVNPFASVDEFAAFIGEELPGILVANESALVPDPPAATQ